MSGESDAHRGKSFRFYAGWDSKLHQDFRNQLNYSDVSSLEWPLGHIKSAMYCGSVQVFILAVIWFNSQICSVKTRVFPGDPALGGTPVYWNQGKT